MGLGNSLLDLLVFLLLLFEELESKDTHDRVGEFDGLVQFAETVDLLLVGYFDSGDQGEDLILVGILFLLELLDEFLLSLPGVCFGMLLLEDASSFDCDFEDFVIGRVEAFGQGE